MEKSTKIRVLITIVAISFIQGLQYCVSPVLSQIAENYPEVSGTMVQMLITAPTYCGLVIALTSGVLVLKITKKKMLIFAGLVSGVVGFIPLFVGGFWVLFVCRVIYGLGLGLATALNAAVVAEWFTGQERVMAMGVQGASVGAGIMITQFFAGKLGSAGFQNAYWINVIGFISMIVIAITLPETGVAKSENGEKVKVTLNSRVWIITFMMIVEYLFLIAYNTNISMHVSQFFSADQAASITGNLGTFFAGSQIVIGIILGSITKISKQYTLVVAYISFAIGAFLLVTFPTSFVMLAAGATFCGISQGIFIPTASVEITNAVDAVSATMAAAVLTAGMNIGQIVSPTVLNTSANVVFGAGTTTNVYKICIVGMLAAGIITFIVRFIRSKKQAA